MEIFIDTADIEEIRDAAAMGVIDGVTTNPSLVAKTGRPFKDVLVDICEVVDGPISAEVIATDYEGILSEGRALAAMHETGDLFYGVHVSDRALTTCLMHEGTVREVHFVDAADGGYALAAKQLKRQLRDAG